MIKPFLQRRVSVATIIASESQSAEWPPEGATTMSTKSDPVSEIQSIFLEKDEVGNMMLDNVFGIIDEQIDLAESRIMRGERPSLAFANMRAAMARMPGATY
jgi:hypothetical protein